MSDFQYFIMTFTDILVMLVVLGVTLLIAWIIFAYITDVNQVRQAVRRNYPVIGRFRYIFEHLGSFFRQYFFAMDREELPFNRAQRSWVYRAAKNVDSTVPFGSTDNMTGAGRVFFVNTAFPTLGEQGVEPVALTIGPYCQQPYTAKSIFNISGMSYGALSKQAIMALSAGAKKANCWLNTGEGGVSPYHLQGGADLIFQIGTAKNGVRDLEGRLSDDKLREVAAHAQIKMFELK
jgi:glutamate synthase domain-containing protein 2